MVKLLHADTLIPVLTWENPPKEIILDGTKVNLKVWLKNYAEENCLSPEMFKFQSIS